MDPVLHRAATNRVLGQIARIAKPRSIPLADADGCLRAMADQETAFAELERLLGELTALRAEAREEPDAKALDALIEPVVEVALHALESAADLARHREALAGALADREDGSLRRESVAIG